MDSERSHQNQHPREERRPKVLVAGEVDVAVGGHPVTLVFAGDRIVIQVADLRTATALLRTPMPSLGPLGKLLSFCDMSMVLNFRDRKAIPIFPKPNRVAKWLIPKVRELSDHR